MNEIILSKEQQLYIKIIDDLHKNWKPHAGQIEAGRPIINNEVSTLFLQNGRKWGKMLDIEELIPTPSGFKKNGDLIAGDIIFDEKGHQQVVLEAHPINHTPDSYEIFFDNGTSVKACGDHLWHTYTKKDRKSVV